MKTTPNRRKQVNPVHFPKLVKGFAVGTVIAAAGLCYVHVKHQHFAISEEIRLIEQQIKNVSAENQVLLAKVTQLSSRTTLQKRISEGFIDMKPIAGNAIARLIPPGEAAADTVMRTAFNDKRRP
jgi:cell division protein FtsL